MHALRRRAPLLFTPGPLSTSPGVKHAMLRDVGSRSQEMVSAIQGIRESLVSLAHVAGSRTHGCVLMQGSGTFAVESVIGSVVPAGGRLLVASNGAYGQRMARMCQYLDIEYSLAEFGEKEPVCPDTIADMLRDAGHTPGRAYTHVAAVHHETTSGILNPVNEIGRVIRDNSNATFILDAMSAFGCYDINMQSAGVDYLISSSNKCLEGVPGFAFVLCNLDALLTEGHAARSLSLDLLGQWNELEESGQFRFTPPTHALLAFQEALRQHHAEGGVEGRRQRYEKNARLLRQGMRDLGFPLYLDSSVQGCIITTFLYPEDTSFDFQSMYDQMSAQGFLIYPGKLTQESRCFRIGSIGHVDEQDVRNLLRAVRAALS